MTRPRAGAIHLLVNPTAGSGRAVEGVRRAYEALSAVAETIIVETRSAGDESRIAHAAIDGSARALAVLGGDGTMGRAARALTERGSMVPLLPLSAGTGNDFVKSLGAPTHAPAAMAALLRAGRLRTIDAGMVDDVPFVNAAGFGFDAAVVARLAADGGARAGRLRYMRAAVGGLLQYDGIHAAIVAAGASRAAERHLLLVFANGRHFGGAFRIAPHARIDDGALDLITVPALSPLRRVGVFARAVRGSHIGVAGVRAEQGAEWRLTFEEAPWFEADGELYRASGTHVRVRVLPSALRVVAPPA